MHDYGLMDDALKIRSFFLFLVAYTKLSTIFYSK
jgi:hypothetical protein